MSYTQFMHTLWDTLKNTLNLDNHLTSRLRSTRSKRAAEADSSRGRLVLMGVLCVTLLQPIQVSAASASKEIEIYKLYAHSRLLNEAQFICLSKLWTKESNWRPNAKNGSHYGIPQLRNKSVRKQDPFTQIDWGLRYIKHRYDLPCKALKAWEIRKAKTGAGWY
jgi:hypothetical protein